MEKGLGKSGTSEKKRCSSSTFGFNGMEKDDEIKGSGNSYDYGARIYDSRVGRWLSRDPLEKKYPSLTPYNFVANSPIFLIDPDGKEIFIYYTGKDGRTNSMRYTPMMEVPSDDEFTARVINNLNQIYQTEQGEKIINDLVADYDHNVDIKSVYYEEGRNEVKYGKNVFTDKRSRAVGESSWSLSGDGDDKFRKLINEGKYEEAARMIDNATLTQIKLPLVSFEDEEFYYDGVYFGDASSLGHELFHFWQASILGGETFVGLFVGKMEGGVAAAEGQAVGFENYLRFHLYSPESKYYSTRYKYGKNISSYVSEGGFFTDTPYSLEEFDSGGSMYSLWKKKISEGANKIYHKKNNTKSK